MWHYVLALCLVCFHEPRIAFACGDVFVMVLVLLGYHMCPWGWFGGWRSILLTLVNLVEVLPFHKVDHGGVPSH